MWQALASPTRVPQYAESADLTTPPTDRDDDGQLPPLPHPNTLRRSTLTEALRSNPFRPLSRDGTSHFATSSKRVNTQEKQPQTEDPVKSLNADLMVLANVHPDLKIEVLRELLVRFDDGDSRLQVCIEELFRHKNEWAKGRLLNPSRDLDEKISLEDLFRRQDYITVCKRTLSAEFKSLNKSVVDGVLAEVNNSYVKARPILQGVAAKTWRAALSSLFKRKKAQDELPSFLYSKATKGARSLCSTGNMELDRELDRIFIEPGRLARRDAQQMSDQILAMTLNQQEAELTGSLFECQCCYNDLPFEQMTACTTELHTTCHDCVRRSLNEALFGQNWTTSVDISAGTLRCVASCTDTCTGTIPANLVENAVLSVKAGLETWNKFEQRLAAENLSRSNLKLINCPFCNYAEAPRLQSPSDFSTLSWRFNFRLPPMTPPTVLFLLLLEVLLPTFFLIFLLLHLTSATPLRQRLHTSLHRLSTRHRTQIFTCKNPTCSLRSCLTCHKQWHDPHTCHEPLILSLRTTVEAARSAALKRTCPRCGTSFVKSSGCNKLTCVCGYAMCYICRKNIGKVALTRPQNVNRVNAVGPGRNNNDALADIEDEALAAAGEGYRHFCEHFRPVQGMRCTECDKCDLYKTEDEDAVVRKAGEEAERIWRTQHVRELNGENGSIRDELLDGDRPMAFGLDSVDIKGLDEAVERYHGRSNARRSPSYGIFQDGVYGLWMFVHGRGFPRRWGLQGLMDEVVARCIVIVDDE